MASNRRGKPSRSEKPPLEIFVGDVLRPLDNFRKNPRRALQTPRATVERLQRGMEEAVTQQIARGNPDSLVRVLFDAVPDNVQQIIERTRQDIEAARSAFCNDAAAVQLLALYDAADANGPIAPATALLSGTIEDDVVDQWTVTAKFMEAQRCRGERRWLTLRDAVPDLIERIYARYARALWILSFLAIGKWPSRTPGTFGSLMQQLPPRLLAFPQAVDADAAHIRNAIAHRHAEYSTSRRTVELRDAKGWQLSLALSDFEARLNRMAMMAVHFTAKLRVIANTQVLLQSGVIELLPVFRDGVRGDQAAIASLGALDVDDRMRGAFLRGKPPADVDPWFLTNY